MNKVILIGRLTGNPEIRTTQSGISVASFRLAVDRKFKQEGQHDVDFIPIVVWGKLVENVVGKYCFKGRQIAVSGRLQTRTWQGEDGNRRYATEVGVEEIQLLANPKGTSNNNGTISETDLEEFIDLGYDEEDSLLPF